MAGYRFRFFSNEGNPIEPCHIHIQKDRSRAKYWLEPFISLEYNYGFSVKELSKFRKIIEGNSETIKNKWNEHFNN